MRTRFQIRTRTRTRTRRALHLAEASWRTGTSPGGRCGSWTILSARWRPRPADPRHTRPRSSHACWHVNVRQRRKNRRTRCSNYWRRSKHSVKDLPTCNAKDTLHQNATSDATVSASPNMFTPLADEAREAYIVLATDGLWDTT